MIEAQIRVTGSGPFLFVRFGVGATEGFISLQAGFDSQNRYQIKALIREPRGPGLFCFPADYAHPPGCGLRRPKVKCETMKRSEAKQNSKTSMNAGRLNWQICSSRFTTTHRPLNMSTPPRCESASNSVRVYAALSVGVMAILILLAKGGAGFAVAAIAYLSMLGLIFFGMFLAPLILDLQPKFYGNIYADRDPDEPENEALEAAQDVQS